MTRYEYRLIYEKIYIKYENIPPFRKINIFFALNHNDKIYLSNKIFEAIKKKEDQHEKK